MEIYQALLGEEAARDVILECPLGTVRPDISVEINGVPVAIEVQISSLSVETIMKRTIEYHRKGIYVLWLLQWTPDLDQKQYAPAVWEKWLHACYYGRLYYWIEKLQVVEYEFEPVLKHVPRQTLFTKAGKQIVVGGYVKRSTRFRTPIRGKRLDLVRDFGPRLRYWWSGGGLTVPDARIFIRDSSQVRRHL